MVAAWESSWTGANVAASAGNGSRWCRLEGVRKSFGDNLVLDGIDLSVALGEVLVVIGPSGSGKSTLLRCVNLLEPIQAGRIFLEGEEITRRGRTYPPYASGSGSCSSSSTSSRT